MANTMTISQIDDVLKSVLQQATGQTNLAALDTKDLLTIGQKSLAVGYDPVMNAISNVITRTIFSNRPYNRKFASLRVAAERWGNYVRKLTVLESDNDLTENPYIPLADNDTVDQYKVSKPKTLQLNFVGQQTYQLRKTVFETQLDTAFQSGEEFGQFISMLMTYCSNKVEKALEEQARQAVSGFIAGKIAGDSANVYHLVTEYNNATGKELTSQTAFAPENFDAFIKWMYAFINTISENMTEYSTKYHTNVNDGFIMRHTPKEMQKLYMYTPVMTSTTARVLADTYHDSLLQLGEVERVNYWQSIETPDTINLASPQYLAANGTIATAGSAVNQDNIVGVLFDEEAIVYSPILERRRVSPPNAEGEYYNMFWKYNVRHSLDFTENGAVFLLD